MHLLGVRVTQLGPFEDVTVPFAEQQRPRLLNVIYGGGGVGKSSLLMAIAATRPGHALVPAHLVREPAAISAPPLAAAPRTPRIECEWLLGQDDPARLDRLKVVTPSARAPEDEREAQRRREQSLFDKLAREAGFAFLSIPSARWFSRQPIALGPPARALARQELRGTSIAEDAARLDLSRDTKQALAQAEIAACLCRASPGQDRLGFALLGEAMKSAVSRLSALAGFTFRGVDPGSFEPLFAGLAVNVASRAVPFDALPTRARHLVAFAALSVRCLWAAYPGRDPRECEGVIAIDEACLHQDELIQARLGVALREALPRVQWILTTSSASLAASCDAREVLALRRLPESERVELFAGADARTH